MQLSRNAPFAEPVAVPDVYASGLGRIENMGDGMMRFTFFTWQASMIDGSMERVVVARIVRPISSLRDSAIDTLSAIEAAKDHVVEIDQIH